MTTALRMASGYPAGAANRILLNNTQRAQITQRLIGTRKFFDAHRHQHITSSGEQIYLTGMGGVQARNLEVIVGLNPVTFPHSLLWSVRDLQADFAHHWHRGADSQSLTVRTANKLSGQLPFFDLTGVPGSVAFDKIMSGLEGIEQAVRTHVHFAEIGSLRSDLTGAAEVLDLKN